MEKYAEFRQLIMDTLGYELGKYVFSTKQQEVPAITIASNQRYPKAGTQHWAIRLSPAGGLILSNDDPSVVEQLERQHPYWLNQVAEKWGSLIIRCETTNHETSHESSSNSSSNTSEDKLKKIAQLGDSQLLKAMEFLAEREAEGRIIVITSNITNLCKHTNDLLTPERGIRQPHEWTGYNYLEAWTIEGESPSDEYFRLLELLQRDGFVSGYEYTLRRPDDKALVRYKTDYLLIKDWLGEPVRIGISRPEDYEVITL